MRRVVVVGASIAGVTAGSTLRAQGWDGELTVLSEEDEQPYSRVPLSKGVLAGSQPPSSTALHPLPDDVEVRLGARAVALHPQRRVVELDDGTEVGYDGLVIATGARARRLAAPGQRSELVVRTLADAAAIFERLGSASSAVVVGAGFLGMEVASTLRHHGLEVTVVDRDPPLRRLLGGWLADLVVDRAVQEGVRFVTSPDGVELVGDPVRAISCSVGEIGADLVVSAVGDLPNVEWLASSGLAIDSGLVVDDRCRAAPGIVGAGDVTVPAAGPGAGRRTPHWSNAVAQGRCAALALLDPDCPVHRTEHYFWTEQFGVNLKLAGELPLRGAPQVLAGDVAQGSALLQWSQDGEPVASAALNHRISIVRLKALGGLAAPAPAPAVARA